MTQPPPRPNPVRDKLVKHLEQAGASPNEAQQYADKLLDEKWRAPQPKAHPPFFLEPLLGARPPWAWMNLTPDEAEFLAEQLDAFVASYNEHLTTTLNDIIPACWRDHPMLVQLLPVLFWSWYMAHRDPAASPGLAMAWHERHLRTFQERLNDNLGDAYGCRQGLHQPPRDHETEQAIGRANKSLGHELLPPVGANWFGTEP